MKNIFRVLHATNVERVEFASYQLKDIAYQLYKEWDQARGYIDKAS